MLLLHFHLFVCGFFFCAVWQRPLWLNVWYCLCFVSYVQDFMYLYFFNFLTYYMKTSESIFQIRPVQPAWSRCSFNCHILWGMTFIFHSTDVLNIPNFKCFFKLSQVLLLTLHALWHCLSCMSAHSPSQNQLSMLMCLWCTELLIYTTSGFAPRCTKS